jgi:hypothetical protein
VKFVGDMTLLSDDLNARQAIDLAVPALGKRKRNSMLASLGVWMIYGHLDPIERSGLCDRGIQYAVIDTNAILGFEPYTFAAR